MTPTLTSLPDLLTLYRNDPRVARIAEGLQPNSARVQIAGTIGSSQALIAASVIDRTQGVHVFVLTDKEEAAYFINDLEALRGVSRTVDPPFGSAQGGKPSADRKHDDLFFYPAPSRSAYDSEGHHDGERVTRTEVLEVLMKQREGAGQHDTSLVIVTYPEALIPLVVAKEVMQKNTLAIKRNEELPIDTLQEWLEETGFTRVEFVYEPGQFSIRGGIVDVFSYGNDKPYRIELYGDTVESVRRFDPQDQLTVERLAEAVIVPDLQDEDAARQQLFFAQLPENATIWLHDLQAIADADNVKGVVFLFQGFGAGLATLQNLHRSFSRLRESGKEVIVYTPMLDIASYYVASVADRIIVPPSTQFDVLGLRMEAAKTSTSATSISNMPRRGGLMT